MIELDKRNCKTEIATTKESMWTIQILRRLVNKKIITITRCEVGNCCAIEFVCRVHSFDFFYFIPFHFVCNFLRAFFSYFLSQSVSSSTFYSTKRSKCIIFCRLPLYRRRHLSIQPPRYLVCHLSSLVKRFVQR